MSQPGLKLRKAAHGTPCPYCTRTMQRGHAKLEPTRDHHIPESKGGTDILIVCIQCNMIKADMMPDQWAAFMERVPGWWKLTKHQIRRARHSAGEMFVTPGLYAGDYTKRMNRAAGLTRSGKPKPVVVPPGLIWQRADLIAATAAQDARLRAPETAACALAAPEATDAPSGSVSAPAPHPGDLL